jgi:hypothetical protein
VRDLCALVRPVRIPRVQVRIARPTGDLAAAVAFYELLELPVLASFEDHDGYSGVVLGLPDATRQLELVRHEDVAPSPTEEDQLVLYLGSEERVAALTDRVRRSDVEPSVPPNPYWGRTGAVCFVDPDGYRLVLSPEAW